MWLPNSVYERVPHFWVLIGILFMAAAVYLGFGYAYSPAYFGIGLLCVVWSSCVIVLRNRRKQRENAESASDEPAA